MTYFVLERGEPRRVLTPTPLLPGQCLCRRDEVVSVDWPGQSDAVRVGMGRAFVVTWSSGRNTCGHAPADAPPAVGHVEYVPVHGREAVIGTGTPRYADRYAVRLYDNTKEPDAVGEYADKHDAVRCADDFPLEGVESILVWDTVLDTAQYEREAGDRPDDAPSSP